MTRPVEEPGSLQERIVGELHNYIHEKIEEETVRVIEKAKAEIEKSIRSQIGSIALGVLKHYEVETTGQRLLITVKNDVKI